MVLVSFLTWEISQQAFHDYIESQLRGSAALAEITIRDGWPYASPQALAARCREMRDRTGLRITIIDPSGNVLAESETEPGRMENHATRPEVREALAGRVGSNRRLSASVGRPYVYVATPLLRNGGVAAVVRVAAPVEDVARREAVLVRWVAAGLAVAVPLAIVIAFAVSRALASPVQRVGVWARRLATGDLDTQLEFAGDDEIGQVAESLERMRVGLAERIRQVQQQRQDLEVTLGNLEEGVVAVNDQGVVLTANAAARTLLGIEGQPVGWPLTVGLRHGALSGLWSEAVASGQGELRRQVILDGPGPRRTVDVTIARVQDGESPIAWLLCVRDITELARSAAMKADFVAHASHELRTPVASIRAAVETLQADGLDAATRARFMGMIERNVERLTSLTEDLMHLNRVESPTPELKITRFALGEVFASLWQAFAEVARRKSAALTFVGEEIQAATDRRWLELIVRNLVDNALKFIGEGGRVEVRGRREGDRTLVEVRDDGCGIPAEDIDRVFERFFQVDKSRSLSAGGTGLGLAIVKHAVTALGGEVSLRSAAGKGTTVLFWVPDRRTG